jgi:hypothetical protein
VVVDQRIFLLSLIVASLAGSAHAADEDPFAAQRKQAASERESAAAPAATADASERPAKLDPAVRPAQFVAKQARAQEPLGFRGAYFDPAGAGTGSVRTSAGTARPGGAQPVINDTEVRPAQYVAQQPYADEPLGFHGARFNPATQVGPPLEAGIFDEPMEEDFDPADPEAPAPTASSRDWVRNGRWYLEQSVVYMNRSAATHNLVALAIDLTSSPVPHFQSVLNIPLDLGAFSPGYRSTVGRYLGTDGSNRDHSVEFTFLGLTHWRSAEDLTAVQPGGIFSLVDASLTTPAFNASDFQSYLYTSSFNSYELNYRVARRPTRDRMIYTRDSTWVRENTPSPLPSLFGGLRVITLNERLNYFAESSVATGNYNVQTHNNLVGLQGGGEWFYQRPEWRIGMRLKGGMLVNWADQISQVRILDANGTPVVPNRDERANKNIAALLGEISFIGAYQFTPRIALRLSYDLMWITDLALAQNQINFTPSNTGSQSSFQKSLMFTGASVGFEINR